MTVSSHIRRHVVGYVAVFLALTGTGAASLPGTNTVDSGDIVAGGVTAPDVGINGVASGTVADGTVASAELAPLGVKPVDLRANAVNSTNVANGTLGGTDFLASGVQTRITGTCPRGISFFTSVGSASCTSPTRPIDLSTPFPGVDSTSIRDWSVSLRCVSGDGSINFRSLLNGASANWLYSNGSNDHAGGTTLGANGTASLSFSNDSVTGQIILSNPLGTATVKFDARFESAGNRCVAGGTALET